MSLFPPKNWQVRHLKDLDLYEVEPPANASKIHMEALLVAKPASGLEGTFRLALGGSSKLLVEMKLTDVWADGAFEDMMVVAEIHNGSTIQLQKNSITSKWVDVEELVRAQEVDVINSEGEEVSDRFLETWDRLRKTHHLGGCLGLVWRWCITTAVDGSGVELLVQALPVNLNHIKNVSELRQVGSNLYFISY